MRKQRILVVGRIHACGHYKVAAHDDIPFKRNDDRLENDIGPTALQIAVDIRRTTVRLCHSGSAIVGIDIGLRGRAQLPVRHQLFDFCSPPLFERKGIGVERVRLCTGGEQAEARERATFRQAYRQNACPDISRCR